MIRKSSTIRHGVLALGFALFCGGILGQPEQLSAQLQPRDELRNVYVAREDRPVYRSRWKTIQPTKSGAEVTVPVTPRTLQLSMSPVPGREPIQVQAHIASLENGLASYILSYHDMLEPTGNRNKIRRALEGAVRGSLATVGGRLISVPESIRYQDHEGHEFHYVFRSPQSGEFRVYSRVLIVGQRQYQLSVIMHTDVAEDRVAERFLDSFRLVSRDLARN